MEIPPILCIVGPSGSGKTHLLERLIPELTARGLRLAAIKHAGHVHVAGGVKDSDRLRQAGGDPAIAGARDACHVQGGGQTPLLDLVGTFCRGRDLVLTEGYRGSACDKIRIVVGDDADDEPPMESVRLRVGSRGKYDIHRDDAGAVAAWVSAWLHRRRTLREGLVGVVLTGGQSRRMGTDKSGLKIGGRGVLARLYELLADWLGEAWIVGRRPACDDLPNCAKWHLDLAPGQGPLGGIATGLRIARADGRKRGACVVACDMPAFGGELLESLLAARGPGAPATALVHPGTGRAEPLAAIYEHAALPSIEKALASSRRGAIRWLESAGAHLAAAPAHLADQLANANTPEEWDAIRLRLEQGAG